MEENKMNPDILTLMDEEGNEHKFEVVDTNEIDGQRYVGLIPIFEDGIEIEDDEDAELIVLKVVSDEGQEFLEAIEDEAEFNKITKIFMEHLQDYYDIIEED